jgi:hypothetical protein
MVMEESAKKDALSATRQSPSEPRQCGEFGLGCGLGINWQKTRSSGLKIGRIHSQNVSRRLSAA